MIDDTIRQAERFAIDDIDVEMADMDEEVGVEETFEINGTPVATWEVEKEVIEEETE